MDRKTLYTSEVYDDDVPYWIDHLSEKDLPDSENEGLLMVPYNYDCKLRSVRTGEICAKFPKVTMANSA